MNSLLLAQMDAYALMKARQGIARELSELHKLRWFWVEDNEPDAVGFCDGAIDALRDLAAHQFSHRPTIPPTQWVDEVGIREEWVEKRY